MLLWTLSHPRMRSACLMLAIIEVVAEIKEEEEESSNYWKKVELKRKHNKKVLQNKGILPVTLDKVTKQRKKRKVKP